jgi:putative addiction module killer protein
MEVSEQEVHEFESPDGDSPFDVWLTGIPDFKTQAKIRARILRVRMGNLGVYKGVGEGVLELVLDFGPGYRVYLGARGESDRRVARRSFPGIVES